MADILTIFHQVALALTASFNSASVAFDFGKHGWRINWEEGDWLLLNMNLAGTFSIIAAAWSKTSFAFTLLRIAEVKCSHSRVGRKHRSKSKISSRDWY